MKLFLLLLLVCVAAAAHNEEVKEEERAVEKRFIFPVVGYIIGVLQKLFKCESDADCKFSNYCDMSIEPPTCSCRLRDSECSNHTNCCSGICGPISKRCTCSAPGGPCRVGGNDCCLGNCMESSERLAKLGLGQCPT